jgi:hypothetical protein
LRFFFYQTYERSENKSKDKLAFQKLIAALDYSFIGKIIAWKLTNSDAVFLMPWKVL